MPLARHDLICLFIDIHIMFLLTCLLRGMTLLPIYMIYPLMVSTHMPLARHDEEMQTQTKTILVSTHMPLARHDNSYDGMNAFLSVSTHMPLARHDAAGTKRKCVRDVSTHMPLARHDQVPYCFLGLAMFLLTCLLRGMTPWPVYIH